MREVRGLWRGGTKENFLEEVAFQPSLKRKRGTWSLRQKGEGTA